MAQQQTLTQHEEVGTLPNYFMVMEALKEKANDRKILLQPPRKIYHKAPTQKLRRVEEEWINRWKEAEAQVKVNGKFGGMS